MARQIIDIGTTANDGTGDPIRTAFDKTNDNFAELYAEVTDICRMHDLTFAIPSGWWDSGDRVTVTSLLSSTSSFAIICNWSPLVMYAGGKDGSLWDISEAGTGVTWGDSVQTVQDLTDNDNDAAQASAALRPALGRAPLGAAPSATLDGGSGPAFLRFDLSDDVMPTTFADGGTYDVFVAGRGGSWVERDVVIAPGADLDIGPTGIAGRNPGILSALGGNPGTWADIVENGVAIVEGTIDPDHLAWLVKRAKANGAKGLLVPGPETLPNPGDPFVDTTGMISSGSATLSVVDGTLRIASSGTFAWGGFNLSGLVVGALYVQEATLAAETAGAFPAMRVPGATTTYVPDGPAPSAIKAVFSATATGGQALFYTSTTQNSAGEHTDWGKLSLRRYIPEEEL